MYPILNIAVKAVRTAGDLVAKYYGILTNMETGKKNSDNFSSNIKKAAKSTIIRTVHKSYPYHSISSEVNSAGEYESSCIQWVISSLDGITNFTKGSPHFALSIAVRIKGRTEVAVIYDPMRNELFTAIRGQGAQLNGYRLRSRKIHNFNNAILATSLPYKDKQYIDIYMNVLSKLYSECIDFRITGSSALDLAYVATNRVDGYFGMGLNPCDFFAGDLIAREAGALACDCSGDHKYSITGNIIVGDPYVVRKLLMISRNIFLLDKKRNKSNATT